MQKGEQPIILVSPRRLPKIMSATQRRALDDGRLLIISIAEHLSRATQQSAHQRNKFILTHSANIVIGYAAPQGRLATAIAEVNASVKFLYTA